METTKLKRFAQYARNTLIETVKNKLNRALAEDSSARRENPKAVQKLEDEIASTSESQVVEKVAYIWFNRFIALRFMDVNRYTKLGIVSPEPGQFQPSILSDAKMGHVDKNLVSDSIKEKVLALLENRTKSPDPQGEAYKLLVVATCNYYAYAMPFLFEKIADYTELLMPDDLLSGNSILSYVREAMTPDVCKDVEVIGWLYQFYISEKKEEIDLKVKNGGKVSTSEIPAKTQLFTPRWIVKYMVENSLGRLWMLNNPSSLIVAKMDYYIKPETTEDDYLKITKPQELKVCDPACGSGHILVYAFDLLFEIYKDAGFNDDDEIIKNILEHNLYGIEIDERAAELAAFALAMKAADKSTISKMFFNDPIKVNICKLETIKFDDAEIDSYMDAIGRDLFTSDLQTTLKQFEEADNFGSLIQPTLKNVTVTLQTLKEKDVSRDLFLAPTHEKVLQVLKQADYLSQKYHVVVANPPYLGSKGMNSRLGKWAKDNYPDSKADLFAMFMERGFELILRQGYSAMITMQSWMFLSSYEKLRHKVLNFYSIKTMAHLDNMVMGIAFGTSATIFQKQKPNVETEAVYFKINLDDLDENKEIRSLMQTLIKPSNAKKEGFFKPENRYVSKQDNFEKIPGSPIAYWASSTLANNFSKNKIANIANTRLGMATADNDRFLRFWNEVELRNIGLSYSNKEDANESGLKWFPYQKGGEYRKWYGNYEYVVNWQFNGNEIQNFSNPDTGKIRSHNYNLEYIFKKGITWNALSSGNTSMRISENSLFDNAGSSLFLKDEHNLKYCFSMLNTKLTPLSINAVSSTLNYQPGDIAKIPILFTDSVGIRQQIEILTQQNIDISKEEWNSREISWDFMKNGLIAYKEDTKIASAYFNFCNHWKDKHNILHRNEEELNKFFIDIYKLQDELTSDVALKDITILKTETKIIEDELVFQTDEIMKQFISYSVGVMFGRYSLDHDGLHIADVDVTVDEENVKFNIKTPTFEADDDNVIPILDGNWFTDDISERFLQFVKVTFGEENYEVNIDFVANALNKKNKNSAETIRKYFIKDFYNDHVKRYKKRPIYWMFSSPKGSFQALIYMHRYKSDTVSVILNDYLRDYITKLEATKENLEAVGIKADANKSEKVKALKEIEKIKKMITELVDYEKDIMYPLATQKIEIDLDDGVKHNYPLFGKALKKVTGLS